MVYCAKPPSVRQSFEKRKEVMRQINEEVVSVLDGKMVLGYCPLADGEEL